MRRSPVWVALAVSVALASSGCGLTSSPAEGLQFKAPPGWQSSPGIMGFMQFWKSPANDKEILMLFKSPKPLDANDLFSSTRENDTLKDVTIRQRRSIQICGNQPATYIEGRGKSSSGGDDDVQTVVTTMNGNTYFAMHIYPVGSSPNAAATAALRELCAKPSES